MRGLYHRSTHGSSAENNASVANVTTFGTDSVAYATPLQARHQCRFERLALERNLCLARLRVPLLHAPRMGDVTVAQQRDICLRRACVTRVRPLFSACAPRHTRLQYPSRIGEHFRRQLFSLGCCAVDVTATAACRITVRLFGSVVWVLGPVRRANRC